MIARLCSTLLIVGSVSSAAPHRILVDRFVPTKIVLYAANADGTDEKPLFPEKPGGLDYNPSLSADGKWIVFTSERDGSADLYRVKADGTSLERLTDDPAYDDQATFSPDGREIIFVSTRDGGRSNLWILNVATHKTRRLTKGVWGDFRPAFSPDGKWIAFTSDRGTPYQAATGHWEQAQLIDVYLMRPDGSGLRRLTQPGGYCGSPKWSRDGQRLAAYCMSALESFTNRPSFPSGKSRLVSIDVATGTMTDLPGSPGVNMSPAFVGPSDVGYVRKDLAAPGIYYTSGKTGPKGTVRSPSWTPDGSRVVYQKMISNDRINGRKYWSREPDFELLGASENPVFNATGDLMLSSQNHKGQWVLNVVDTHNWKETLFYQAPGKSAMNGHWSPRGDTVVFALGSFFNNRFTTLQGAQLATIKTDGSGFQELTHGTNNNNFPSYSQDGNQLVYRTIGPEGQGLRIMNLADHAIRAVTNAADNFPSWSPRGDLIVFTRYLEDGNFEIFTVRPDGSDVRRLTNAVGNEGHAIWSPDGETILFLSARMGFKDEALYLDGQQPQGELFVMKYDGTGVRQLTDNQWEDGMAAWWPEPVAVRSRR
jgi:Tol biopolymer transport system component